MPARRGELRHPQVVLNCNYNNNSATRYRRWF